MTTPCLDIPVDDMETLQSYIAGASQDIAPRPSPPEVGTLADEALEDVSSTRPSPTLEHERAESLFLAPGDNTGAEMSVTQEEKINTVIKEEPSSPAPRTVEDYEIDHTGDDDDGAFPDIAQILARPAPVTQDFQMLDEDDDDPDEDTEQSDADGDADHVDVPDHQSTSPRSPKQAAKQEKRRNKPRVKLARTAREWHKRRQAKLKPHQQRGPAWKRKKISEIRAEMKKGVKQRRKIKLSKRRKEAQIDPRTFLDSARHDEELTSPQRDLGEEAVVNSALKKDWWKQFLELNHNVDLHKCKVDWNDLLRATRSFGLNRMTPEGNKWRLEGMKTTLYHHQVLGLDHIVKRECSAEGPWGTICADDMGMGKTLQTIAAIIANPPTPERVAMDQKTTLIVVPSSLRSQWFREIKKHAPLLADKVMQFKSSLEDNSTTRLKQNDIVLTTYWELMQSLPNPDKKLVAAWVAAELDLFEEYQTWADQHPELMGMLHRVNWYRVVLDEGHFIKNYLSRTSRAAVAIEGQYRLLLSGTPIMNKYEEFHPLFRFLREPLTTNMSPTQFAAGFCDKDDFESSQCLSIILSDLIIHRTTKDTLFDKPIIQLPADHRSLDEFEAQKAEALLYLAFEARLGELKSGTFGEKDERTRLKSRYAQLTRLRQLTANPDIIAQQIIVLFNPDELKRLKTTIGAMRPAYKQKSIAHGLYTRLDQWIKDKRNDVYKEASEDAEEEQICLNCEEPSEDLVTLKSCGHVYCKACLDEEAMEELDENDNEVQLCPNCGTTFKKCHIIPCNPPKPAAKEGKKSAAKSVKRGKDANGFRPSPARNQFCFELWLERYDKKTINLLPSAKLMKVGDRLSGWVKEAPMDKIIVFTQFRHNQVMLGCLCEAKKIPYLYFSGDMTTKQREKAINDFRDDPHIKVMIAGLKCGGLGLNLSFANRVIICDIWWNVCIDNQAFGRVFRIGQEKESHYVKMVVSPTVDLRTILKLQMKKETKIKAVMQDDLEEQEFEDILAADTNETFGELLDRYDAESQNGDPDSLMAQSDY